ncbi:hypothetical protein GCM10020331_025460 [Ectobacillus funiculus]
MCQQKDFLDEEYIKERRQLINPDKATTDVKEGDPWKYEGKDSPSQVTVKENNPIGQTTHFSVMDKWGGIWFLIRQRSNKYSDLVLWCQATDLC